MFTPFTVRVAAPDATRLDLADLVNARTNEVEVTADINHRPIRVWTVRSAPDRVESVYVVGHADGACCPLVSGIVEQVAGDPAFQGAWFTYGAGMISAADPAQARRLHEMDRKLTEVAARSECSGQVVLQTMDTDEIAQSSARMVEIGAKLFQGAADAGRPVLLWHAPSDSLPRFVPVTVGAGKAPLTIELGLDELQIPPEVRSGLTLDGVGKYIAEVTERLGYIERLLGLADAIHALGGRSPDAIRHFRLEFGGGRIDDARAEVLAATARLRSALTYAERLAAAYELVGLDASESRRFGASVQESLRTNQRALAQVGAASLSSPDNRAEFDDVTFTASQSPISGEKVRSLRSERNLLKAELSRAKQLRQKPRRDPMPVLIDAFLRGWPATFSSADGDKAFDAWVQAEQKRVWGLVETRLNAAGASFSDAGRALLLSNVMFRARLDATGKRVLVTPTFILSGPGFQVADTGAGVVRYESATAEQNVLGW
ncbi:hypothetical protein BE08_04480 [Sorangium cellulosum]|uniref:Uncharacterized protein n=1 Tax=Sorangium cellulosum TaxID=56 RepID=A0A150PM83_SORCE|nr:hypothetical protein BE08_04480 [Sorangium cellulosum]